MIDLSDVVLIYQSYRLLSNERMNKRCQEVIIEIISDRSVMLSLQPHA